MGRSGTEWMPSAKQRKIVELLINPEDDRTKKDKLAEAGVPKQTFYRWMQEDRFRRYLSEQVDLYTDGELPEAWKALMLKVKGGDTAAIKLYFELKNKYSQHVVTMSYEEYLKTLGDGYEY